MTSCIRRGCRYTRCVSVSHTAMTNERGFGSTTFLSQTPGRVSLLVLAVQTLVLSMPRSPAYLATARLRNQRVTHGRVMPTCSWRACRHAHESSSKRRLRPSFAGTPNAAFTTEYPMRPIQRMKHRVKRRAGDASARQFLRMTFGVRAFLSERRPTVTTSGIRRR